MTGPQHFRASERLLEQADDPDLSDREVDRLIARAQVHATLAMTAATALPAEIAWHGEDDVRSPRHWAEALAIKPPVAVRR